MSSVPLQVQFDPAAARFCASRSQKRLEDDRLLTGRGRYSDDLELPNQCWLVLARSPHAHARIRAVDLAAVKGAPGVIAAWTIAEMRGQAQDAAELAAIEYEDLPCVVDVKAAIAPAAPLVWPQAAGNIAAEAEYGDRAAVQAAMARAAHVTEIELHNQRVIAMALEPRAC